MMDASKEAIAISIFAIRLGFDPKTEMGMQYGDDGTVAISLLKPTASAVTRINIEQYRVSPKDFSKVFKEWSDSVVAILSKAIPENQVQKIWESSDFSKYNLTQVIERLMKNGCLIPRAFKLEGDSEYRCAECGINKVSGIAGEDTCGPCKEKLI